MRGWRKENAIQSKRLCRRTGNGQMTKMGWVKASTKETKSHDG